MSSLACFLFKKHPIRWSFVHYLIKARSWVAWKLKSQPWSNWVIVHCSVDSSVFLVTVRGITINGSLESSQPISDWCWEIGVVGFNFLGPEFMEFVCIFTLHFIVTCINLSSECRPNVYLVNYKVLSIAFNVISLCCKDFKFSNEWFGSNFCGFKGKPNTFWLGASCYDVELVSLPECDQFWNYCVDFIVVYFFLQNVGSLLFEWGCRQNGIRVRGFNGELTRLNVVVNVSKIGEWSLINIVIFFMNMELEVFFRHISDISMVNYYYY